MKITEVTFDWFDGRITTESFKTVEEVYDYIDDMSADGQDVDDFTSNNPDWMF